MANDLKNITFIGVLIAVLWIAWNLQTGNFMPAPASSLKADSTTRDTSGPFLQRPYGYNIEGLVAAIASYEKVDDDGIGIAGQTSDQYYRYLNLAQAATSDELIKLTDHFSPVVRVYAFWALASRNHAATGAIYKKHLADSAYVSYQSGCIIFPHTVSEMYKYCLANREYHRRNVSATVF